MDDIRALFASITERYDLLNRLLSLGHDVLWRRYAVRKMRFFKTRRLLDLACGTCDISIMASRWHGGVRVVGVDLARQMLLLGRKKAKKLGGNTIPLVEGDALSLPFRDDSFDVSIVAFGLRNMGDRGGAIREMARVTHPSGQVMILEMTLKGDPALKSLFGWYVKRVIPFVGGWLSSNESAYRYLSRSISLFLSPEDLRGLMERQGLKHVQVFRLPLGITYLHVGIKP